MHGASGDVAAVHCKLAAIPCFAQTSRQRKQWSNRLGLGRTNYLSTQMTNHQELVNYINYSWTPFHAVEEASRRLLAAGFTHISEKSQWQIKVGGWGRRGHGVV